jgi:hypothetical protein
MRALDFAVLWSVTDYMLKYDFFLEADVDETSTLRRA